MQHALLNGMAVSCHSSPGLEDYGQPAQPGAMQLLGHPGSTTLLVLSHLPAGHRHQATFQQLHSARLSPMCRSGRPAVHMLHKQPASGGSNVHLRLGLQCLMSHKEAGCTLDTSGSCLHTADAPACWACHGQQSPACKSDGGWKPPGSQLVASQVCTLLLVAGHPRKELTSTRRGPGAAQCSHCVPAAP